MDKIWESYYKSNKKLKESNFDYDETSVKKTTRKKIKESCTFEVGDVVKPIYDDPAVFIDKTQRYLVVGINGREIEIEPINPSAKAATAAWNRQEGYDEDELGMFQLPLPGHEDECEFEVVNESVKKASRRKKIKESFNYGDYDVNPFRSFDREDYHGWAGAEPLLFAEEPLIYENEFASVILCGHDSYNFDSRSILYDLSIYVGIGDQDDSNFGTNSNDFDHLLNLGKQVVRAADSLSQYDLLEWLEKNPEIEKY